MIKIEYYCRRCGKKYAEKCCPPDDLDGSFKEAWDTTFLVCPDCQSKFCAMRDRQENERKEFWKGCEDG